MKVIILCGGLGTRIGEETKIIPKPMVKIDKNPILIHIMKIYYKYGYKDFILALGYKGKYIYNFFKKKKFKFNVKPIFTGFNTLTGSRLLKLKKYLKNEQNFMVTYGDGLTNQNIKKLVSYHKKSKKICTMTVVRHPVRFGEIILKKNKVISFKEKPQLNNSWINGGFFVFKNDIFKFLSKKNEMLETRAMEKLLKKKQIAAFKHTGFWQCMDTSREKKYLSQLIKLKKAPWMG